VASAHPLASEAAAKVLENGGSAVDAAIAAQAVICVVMPQAAGLGGDVLALVSSGGEVEAVNGTGLSPAGMVEPPDTTGGSSITVPGLVHGWATLHTRWGVLPLPQVLAAAIHLAAEGIAVERGLAAAVEQQHARLVAGGAAQWSLLRSLDRGCAADRWKQPQLALLLASVAYLGPAAFYAGDSAGAIERAVSRCGGSLSAADLKEHVTPRPDPIAVAWAGGTAHVQPPASQGVLLAMTLQCVQRLRADGVEVSDHLLVEATEAAFAHRSSAGAGASLLDEELSVNLERASRRGGPRAYLHTAGVATADRHGQTVSSLVSVFDDFGSCVFVPELGIVMNNRAAGFTDGANAPAPSRRPVHTLAPALLTYGSGETLALATPGADGQVQTLLQILAALATKRLPVLEAVVAPRWRSQDEQLLVERGHPARGRLVAKGHSVVDVEPGAELFGAVVAAGVTSAGPFSVADWRRSTSALGVS
jgi:gamma-glutamyltranspeptidase/glutathione hydrolase